MAKARSSVDRLLEQVPAVPRLKSPGPLGVKVMQDEARPGFDRSNALLKMAGVRPDLVMIGDSLTAGWQAGPLLADLFPIVVNRGIGGDSAKWLVHRIDADVVQLRPRAVTLMIGTNDISHRFGYDSNAKIVRDYRNHMTAILDQIARAKLEAYIGTIPPVRPTMLDDVHNRRKQECIPPMNDVLARLVRRRRMHLVDYYPQFLAEDGASLRADLATDSCHHNARGQYLLTLTLRQAVQRARAGE